MKTVSALRCQNRCRAAGLHFAEDRGTEAPVQVIERDGLPARRQSQLEFTRDLGTVWLQKEDTALLRVPSAIVPETVNFLLNPFHPDAKQFRIIEALQYSFDVRLKK